MKNKIMAIIGGFVALFGLGYLIYVVIGVNALDSDAAVAVFTKLDLFPIIVMELLYAAMLTIVFSKWTTISSFGNGAVAGLVIGAFIGGCSALEVFATSDLLDLTGVLSNTVTFGLRFAVAGGIIGLLLGKTEQ